MNFIPSLINLDTIFRDIFTILLFYVILFSIFVSETLAYDKQHMNKEALRISLIYAIISFAWIILSDNLLQWLISDPHTYQYIQTYKGIAFVSLTTLFIYLWVTKEMKKKNSLISRQNKRNIWHNQLIKNIPEVDVLLFNNEKKILLAQGNSSLDSVKFESFDNPRELNEILIKDNLIEHIENELIDILAGKTTNSEWEYTNKWYELRGEPIIDETNTIIAGLIVVINITNQKRIQEKLKGDKNKAEKNDNLKSAFLANLSHEIRTPLNGMLGFSNLLSQDGINDANKKLYAGIILNNGKQLLRMIDDILDMAKLETGQLRIYYEAANINELLNEVTELLKARINEKNKPIKVITTLSNISDEPIICDRDRLFQILTNLTNNAEKFTQTGSISIDCSKYDNNLLFKVVDTGDGIEADTIPHVFERFAQADSTIEKAYGGSGLGLSICNELLILMDGQIWAESKKNEGSSFYFTIPIRSEDDI